MPDQSDKHRLPRHIFYSHHSQTLIQHNQHDGLFLKQGYLGKPYQQILRLIWEYNCANHR